MKKANRLRRAFTVVELVIVIAVVAILAAVLIPTMVNVVAKAQISADEQKARSMNTVLATANVTGEGCGSMGEVFALLEEAGIPQDAFFDVKKSGNRFAWDGANDEIVYLDKNFTVLFPKESASARALYIPMLRYEPVGGHGAYLMADYAGDIEGLEGDLEIASGKQVTGDVTVTDAVQVSIVGNVAGTIVVDNAEAEVTHDGTVENVEIISAAQQSYHEFGTVLGALKLVSGRAVLEAGAQAKVCLAPGKEQDATLLVRSGSKHLVELQEGSLGAADIAAEEGSTVYCDTLTQDGAATVTTNYQQDKAGKFYFAVETEEITGGTLKPLFEGEMFGGSKSKFVEAGTKITFKLEIEAGNGTELYDFFGWRCNGIVDEGNGKETEYTFTLGGSIRIGAWLAAKTKTINGIVYTLNSEGGTYYYSVTGVDEDNIGDYVAKVGGDTTVGGDTVKELWLENEIDGISVTKIAANALSRNGKTTTFRHIYVPANITEVGEKAFLDNFGIQTIVFFAETVKFCGNGNDKTNPFYGCTSESDNYKTNLTLYIPAEEQIKSDSGSWDRLRNGRWIGLTHYDNCTLGNEEKIKDGNWIYVQYNLDDEAKGVVGGAFESGIKMERQATDGWDWESAALTDGWESGALIDVWKSAALDACNEITASKYIDGFDISAGCLYQDNTSYIVCTVKKAETARYLLTLNRNFDGAPNLDTSAIDAALKEKEYNGQLYIRCGEDLSLVFPAKEGYVRSFESGNEEIETFTMPTEAASLTVTYKAMQFKVTIVSDRAAQDFEPAAEGEWQRELDYTYDSGALSLETKGVLGAHNTNNKYYIAALYEGETAWTEVNNILADVTLQAEWKPLNHVVYKSVLSFVGAGEKDGMYVVSDDFGVGYTHELLEPEKEGYTFLGWWYETEGTWAQQKDDLVGIDAEDTSYTLEALWAKNITGTASGKRSYRWDTQDDYEIAITISEWGALCGVFADKVQEGKRSYTFDITTDNEVDWVLPAGGKPDGMYDVQDTDENAYKAAGRRVKYHYAHAKVEQVFTYGEFKITLSTEWHGEYGYVLSKWATKLNNITSVSGGNVEIVQS